VSCIIPLTEDSPEFAFGGRCRDDGGTPTMYTTCQSPLE
jgi:hypothetical protein